MAKDIVRASVRGLSDHLRGIARSKQIAAAVTDQSSPISGHIAVLSSAPIKALASGRLSTKSFVPPKAVKSKLVKTKTPVAKRRRKK